MNNEIIFDIENKAQWAAAITKVFGDAPPTSKIWTDMEEMIQVIAPFMGGDLNNTMLPDGGGYEMKRVLMYTREPGCLQFPINEKLRHVFQPAKLIFEHFPDSPWNSFLLLELEKMDPVLVDEDKWCKELCKEEVTHDGGDYIDVDKVYEAEACGIPVPSGGVIVRYLYGKIMIMAKRSIWNLTDTTYDGRHSEMSSKQIRECIQKGIDNVAGGCSVQSALHPQGDV